MTRHLDEHEFELPESLRATLRETDAPPAPPIDLDARVMRDARGHLRSRFGRRNLAFKIGLPLAAAAAVGLAFIFSQPGTSPQQPQVAQQSEPPAPGDLNGDGRIDIVDSYLLASQLDRSNLDLNGDGRIDQTDVDLLASQAVKLQ